MSSKDQTALTQFSEPLTVPWTGNNSGKFNARGARGLLIFIPNGWLAATLDFYGIMSTQPVLLHDDTGNKLLIDNIVTTAAGLYIAPAGVWSIGALETVQFFSRNVGDTAFVDQTIDNVIVYPLR